MILRISLFKKYFFGDKTIYQSPLLDPIEVRVTIRGMTFISLSTKESPIFVNMACGTCNRWVHVVFLIDLFALGISNFMQ